MDMFPHEIQHQSAIGALHALQESMSLKDLLGLASQLHIGRVAVSQKDMDELLNFIRRKATDELDVGDGLKVETVRVERKLDGSVSIFFGF